MINHHLGLGDTVEAIAKATGVKTIVEAGAKIINKPCGCQKRKEILNNMVPYKKK